MDEDTERARLGIEILTLWLEPGDEGRAFASDYLEKLISVGQTGHGGYADYATLWENGAKVVGGLFELCRRLLFELTKERGLIADEDLLAQMVDVLRHVSARLPE